MLPRHWLRDRAHVRPRRSSFTSPWSPSSRSWTCSPNQRRRRSPPSNPSDLTASCSPRSAASDAGAGRSTRGCPMRRATCVAGRTRVALHRANIEHDQRQRAPPEPARPRAVISRNGAQAGLPPNLNQRRGWRPARYWWRTALAGSTRTLRSAGRGGRTDLTATIGLCFCAVFGLLGGRPGTFVKVWRVPPTSPLAPLSIAAARLLQKGV